MSKNLLKRIFTSVVLLIILFIINYNGSLIFLLSLIIVSIIIFDEFINIFKKILGPLFLKSNFKTATYGQLNFKYLLINFLVFIYLLFIFSLSTYKIHYLESSTLFLFVICTCFLSDIGGYVLGKTIGGKRLTKISPNKTISGSAGSFGFSLISIPIFSYSNIELNFNIILLIFCLLISFVNQLGDLFISYLKRKAKIKDTGKILPGHGGMLDRFDGIIFALPFSYLLLNLIK